MALLRANSRRPSYLFPRRFLYKHCHQQLLRRRGASLQRLFACLPSLAGSSSIACLPSLAVSLPIACLPSSAGGLSVALVIAPVVHDAVLPRCCNPPPLEAVFPQLDSAVCPASFRLSALFLQAGMAALVYGAHGGFLAYHLCTATHGSSWCLAAFTAAAAGSRNLSLASLAQQWLAVFSRVFNAAVVLVNFTSRFVMPPGPVQYSCGPVIVGSASLFAGTLQR